MSHKPWYEKPTILWGRITGYKPNRFKKRKLFTKVSVKLDDETLILKKGKMMNTFYVKQLGGKWLLHGKGQKETYTLGLFDTKDEAIGFACQASKDYDVNKWEKIRIYNY